MGKRRARKGSGNIYKPPGHEAYYIRFRDKGRDITLPTRTADKAEAERIRRKYLAEMESGIPLNAHKVTLTDLMEMKVRDYQKRDFTTMDDMLRHFDMHLLPYFGPAVPAMDITPAHLAAYQAHRKAEEIKDGEMITHPTNGQINRELATLCSAYNLARKQGILPILPPYYDKLPELRKRTTFWREGEFQTLMTHWKSEWTRPLLQFMNLTGWRLGEVQRLTWAENVDWQQRHLILREGTTKSKEPRIFPFHFMPELENLLKSQLEITVTIEQELSIRIPWVFHRQGREIRNFYKEWKAAMQAGKFIGKKRHDFRSTAIRRLLRVYKVDPDIARLMVGWSSLEMMEYYNVTEAADIHESLDRSNPEDKTTDKATLEVKAGGKQS